VPLTFTYDAYQACLLSGEIDAVYIALPNSHHCEFAVRALEMFPDGAPVSDPA
jgi:glucose-fructose oxidoreductase